MNRVLCQLPDNRPLEEVMPTTEEFGEALDAALARGRTAALAAKNIERINAALTPAKLFEMAGNLRTHAEALLLEAKGLEDLAYMRAEDVGGGEPDQGASA